MGALKEILMSPPVLAFPNPTGHITITADDGTFQVRFVLYPQQKEGTSKPLGYWSSSDAERE